ncbi:probable serine/threonine-protein kinase PBL26 [Impatiens glandulifera]|uniref:probable serine/threonine-protein kinase PBL26 n=1 Tax=Impatiens glandulifera TaxID=253017 RepID=UPI001FB0501F|nr:probable serine/threonine-protein kinase PBL26 [Impatiens glandulifera]XP_047335923.1 probable serine/threonine-protein kinase PBL26 [Impatiens glandulifera]
MPPRRPPRRNNPSTRRPPRRNNEDGESTSLEKKIEKSLKGLIKLTEEEFQICKAEGILLGEGNFGKVYQVEYQYEDYAMKVYQDRDKPQWEVERNILSMIQHKNVVKIYGYSEGKEENSLLIELLASNVHEKLGEIYTQPWTTCVQMFKEIAQGIKGINDAGFVIGDLKFQNMMFNMRDEVKIIDLGGANTIGEKITILTEGYCPPEFRNGVAHHNSDVYSLGVLILQVIMKKTEEDIGTTPVKATFDKNQHITRDAKNKGGKSNEGGKSLVDKEWTAQGCSKTSAKKISSLAMKCTEFSENRRATIDETDAKKISSLAMKCTKFFGNSRPTIDEAGSRKEGIASEK